MRKIQNPFKDPQDDSIVSLGKMVSYLSSEVSGFIKTHDLPEPSFDPKSTPSISEEQAYEDLRAALNDAALDLLQLVNGPKATLRQLIFSHYDLAALQVALERNLFNHVPLPEDASSDKAGASVSQIAEKAGMDEDRTARVLSFLTTQRIFKQVSEDHFEHTASSALLARDPGWSATAAMQMDEMFKAASETSDLIEQSPYRSDNQNSAFHTRFNVPVYKYYEDHPTKGTRFAQAMSSWSQLDRQLVELQNTFDWASLGAGKVVDVGGGSGHISIGLAKKFPQLRFVVQDASDHMLVQARDSITPDLRDRVTFQQHDFFSPQPVHDANAFFLRQCLHNYNDDDCTKILRALVPALEKCAPGTPLLINDIILPLPDQIYRYQEHLLRQVDLTMMVVFGAKQRTFSDFTRLLKRADPRFQIVTGKYNRMGVGLVIVHFNHVDPR